MVNATLINRVSTGRRGAGHQRAVRERSMPIIIHLKLDAFFPSVEVLLEPALAGRPLVIGSDPRGGAGRGVVATTSREAEAYGIRSAMPVAEAYRLCPTAVFRPPRFDLYRDYSERVMAKIEEIAVAVEPVSIDEVFLDTGQDYAGSLAAARRLQATINDEIGLTATLGLAASKLVAKISSNAGQPGDITGVQPGDERAFLAPLSVAAIWEIGPVTLAHLHQQGITTIGQLAALGDTALMALLGSRGPELGQLARGLDDRPLAIDRDRQQIARETTFNRPSNNAVLLRATLARLVREVADRMDQRQVWGRTVVLRVRFDDHTTLSRRLTPGPLITDVTMLNEVAGHLLQQVVERHQSVQLISVAVDGLEPLGTTHQLPLLGWREAVPSD